MRHPGRLRRMAPRALVIVLAVFAVVVAVPVQAQASFRGTASGSVSASSGTLAAPGVVSVSNSQCGVVVLTQAEIRVIWLITPSTYATGYLVTPQISGVAQTAVAVSGRSTLQQDMDVVRGTTYTFTVQAVYRNWTSTPVTSPALYCNIILG